MSGRALAFAVGLVGGWIVRSWADRPSAPSPAGGGAGPRPPSRAGLVDALRTSCSSSVEGLSGTPNPFDADPTVDAVAEHAARIRIMLKARLSAARAAGDGMTIGRTVEEYSVFSAFLEERLDALRNAGNNVSRLEAEKSALDQESAA